MKSNKWELNKADLKRIAKNALIFLAPIIAVELELWKTGASLDQYLFVFKVWLYGIAIDFFRKLKAS